jgi:hypothetical protein
MAGADVFGARKNRPHFSFASFPALCQHRVTGAAPLKLIEEENKAPCF